MYRVFLNYVVSLGYNRNPGFLEADSYWKHHESFATADDRADNTIFLLNASSGNSATR